MKTPKIIAALTLVGLLAGCASSAVVVGKVRPAISPAQVKLYLNPPKKYEEVALLESSSQASFSFSDQEKMNVVVNKLKVEAAKVGANGVLLRGTRDQHGGSISTGGFTGAIGLGASIGMMHKTGTGVAIFVEAE